MFRLCQLFVVIIRAITPFSYIYLSTLLLAIMLPDGKYLPGIVQYIDINDYRFVLVTAYMMIEALFFGYYYYLFNLIDNDKNGLQHFACTKETRKKLVRNCFESMKISCPRPDLDDSGGSDAGDYVDPEKHIRKVIEGWHLDTPIIDIQYNNVLEWCGWAFFGKNVQDMSDKELAENSDIVAYIEQQAKWTFSKGNSDKVRSARLTLDPIFATQRPFFFYGTVLLFNALCHLILYFIGFRRKSEFDGVGQKIYYRPKVGDSNGALPIVFIHGIGIGFLHYLGIILSFPRNVDVYLVEWPHVSMQLSIVAPRVDSTVSSFIKMLSAYGHEQACFVAHSLGTSALSWMLHDPIGKKVVASTVLLDPVTFLLCDPTLATSFVYKDPRTTIDFLMHFCLSQELFIANALSRHFNWSHNIMFVEDLVEAFPRDNYRPSGNNTIHHSIFLSSHDAIVPVGPVSRYLDIKLRKGALLGDVTPPENAKYSKNSKGTTNCKVICMNKQCVLLLFYSLNLLIGRTAILRCHFLPWHTW